MPNRISNAELKSMIAQIQASMLTTDDVRRIAREEAAREVREVEQRVAKSAGAVEKLANDIQQAFAKYAMTDASREQQLGEVTRTVSAMNTTMASRLDDLFKFLEADRSVTGANTAAIERIAQNQEDDTEQIRDQIDALRHHTASAFIRLTGDNPFAPESGNNPNNLVAQMGQIEARQVAMDTRLSEMDATQEEIKDDIKELKGRPDSLTNAVNEFTPAPVRALFKTKTARQGFGGLLLAILGAVGVENVGEIMAAVGQWLQGG